MKFIVGGGHPDRCREEYMIKDDDGYIMTTKSYVKSNPHLFKYLGHVKINSVLIHTYRFLG